MKTVSDRAKVAFRSVLARPSGARSGAARRRRQQVDRHQIHEVEQEHPAEDGEGQRAIKRLLPWKVSRTCSSTFSTIHSMMLCVKPGTPVVALRATDQNSPKTQRQQHRENTVS